jgi:ribosome-binding factor A
MRNRNDKRHGVQRPSFERAGSSIRSARLEELIREELNSLLEGEINDERLEGAWITAVEMSPDGARARIW